MNYKSVGALMVVTMLGGCATNLRTPIVDSRRGLAPQSAGLIEDTERAGTDKNSPVLLRIFKEEKELELWRKKDSEYVLVHTYPICEFSGVLGPKLKQGDRQAPEGFYSITSGQLNYQSIRFVSLNIGYPNQFDQENNRTGGDIMIHGGCDSRGCFAVEDAPSQEIFTAVRDALKHGQKKVQLQIYPFRMTNYNMALHSESKHIDFWKDLKVGYEKYELTRQELRVTVHNRKYTVN